MGWPPSSLWVNTFFLQEDDIIRGEDDAIEGIKEELDEDQMDIQELKDLTDFLEAADAKKMEGKMYVALRDQSFILAATCDLICINLHMIKTFLLMI